MQQNNPPLTRALPLDKAIDQYPELAEAHRLKAYWIHSITLTLRDKISFPAYGDL